LAIGAGIAAGTMIVAFFVFGMFSEPELAIQPTPAIQKNGPPKITLTTFVENGSPILGNPNAPVTLVEFGDYQCFYCNKFFHTTEEKIFKEYVETGKVRVIFKDYTQLILKPSNTS
jgi:protein-disulfide isomerase